MKERLAQFLKSEGLTAVKFAEIMEVQPSSISHLLSGRNKPNFEFISRLLLRFPALNPDWIINGAGGVYKRKDLTEEPDITEVNKEKFTDVIGNGLINVNDNIDEIKQGDMFDNERNMSEVDSFDGHVTSVTKGEGNTTGSFVPEMDKDMRKSISRIIIFYTDGSFDEYHN